MNLPPLNGEVHHKEAFLRKLLDNIKKTPLLSEKYIEILEFTKKFSKYYRKAILLKLLEVSKESDLETHFFNIFRIPEQMQDIEDRVASYCSIIEIIKGAKLFEVHYKFIEKQFIEVLLHIFPLKDSIVPFYKLIETFKDTKLFEMQYKLIERQFIEVLHHIFPLKDSIVPFYKLIETFKDTKLFEMQYSLIEEKFLSFLIHDFTYYLVSVDKRYHKDVEYDRANAIFSMINIFKGTPILKYHYKPIEGIIHAYVKDKDRIQTLMKELHQDFS